MQQKQRFPRFRKHISAWRTAAFGLAALTLSAAWAQTPADSGITAETAAPPPTLGEMFESAWALQPEARGETARRDAAGAARAAAQSWTAEAPALELRAESDRPGSDDGAREYEYGLALPLWLPGERARAAELADATLAALDSRRLAARLRVAAEVRDAWWAWQRASGEAALAADRTNNARALAADVARRAQAGELARADQHQADGALAQAESLAAEATGARDAAWQTLRALAGLDGFSSAPEPAPELTSEALTPELKNGDPASHPALAQWLDRLALARRAASLEAVRTRPNPELALSATRIRERSGESFDQTFTLALRIPFGASARHQARLAEAKADESEAEAQADTARRQIAAETAAARIRLRAAQARSDAAEKRARLALESRAFFDKSFRLGETDLPTRLRIELEALEAGRDAARARIDAAAAVSALRQALGLLPR